MTRITTAFGKPVIEHFIAEQKLEPTQKNIQECKEGMREARKFVVKKNEAALIQIKNQLGSKELDSRQAGQTGKRTKNP